MSLVLILTALTAATAPPESGQLPVVPDMLTPAPQVRIIELPPRPDYEPYLYTGRIIAITKKSVTIKFERGVKKIEIWRQKDGSEIHRVYVQDNTQPPREFTFSADLLNEKWGGSPWPDRAHRVSDLRVGDLVTIDCARVPKADICAAVGIFRRPGGKVPPTVHDELSTGGGWHDHCNAQQFAEEKVLPKLMPRVGLQFVR